VSVDHLVGDVADTITQEQAADMLSCQLITWSATSPTTEDNNNDQEKQVSVDHLVGDVADCRGRKVLCHKALWGRLRA